MGKHAVIGYLTLSITLPWGGASPQSEELKGGDKRNRVSWPYLPDRKKEDPEQANFMSVQ